MRVLVIDPVLSTLPYDRALCAALAEEGHNVCLLGRPLRDGERWDVPMVAYRALSVEDVFRPTDFSGWPLRLLTLSRHLRYAVQIQKIMAVVEVFRPDVIHVQWCLMPLAEILLLRRLRKHAPVCLTVHDTNPFNGTRVSSLVTRGLHTLMRRFDHLVVHTRSAAETLVRRGLPNDRVSVVPHGLLGSTASDIDMERDRTRPLTCLLFGHVKFYKGVDVLIRAVAAMPPAIRETMRFVVAGQPGVDIAELRHLCASTGVSHLFQFDLRFLPEAEVESLLKRADIFAFPYREIQASGVFTMALAYGRPIVASDLGIFSERIADGVSGFLVRPEDPEALAEALRRLGSDADLRARMGAASLAASKAYPGWREIAQLTTAVYDAALAGRGRVAAMSGV